MLSVAALAVTAVFGAPVALAQNEVVADAPEPSKLAIFQAKEQRLFRVGWRIADGNKGYCAHTEPSAGILLHDARSYSDPAGVRAALGLAGDIAVQAIATGSQADIVGIAPNDTLLAVNAQPLAALVFDPEKPWTRLSEVRALMAGQIAEELALELSWQTPGGDARTARMGFARICASRFELLADSRRAMADGERVIFGEDFPGHAWQEQEFAAAVAHELAHNLLGHRALLDAAGRKRKLVRATEREADRLMPWLLANAMYDPEAALRFMQLWGPKHSGGLFRKRTHEGWDERAEHIAAELEAMRAAPGTEWARDWKTYFAREERVLAALAATGGG